jgi:hypothetical protein
MPRAGRERERDGTPVEVPLRVDFAGGWLDVPKLARPGGYIVNCAIQPLVSATDWPYEIGSGLGGSAAKLILDGKDGVREELATGVGWQDPAVILQTGLCVWKSGPEPVLETRVNPEWLEGQMLLRWTGRSHNTPDYIDTPRDYDGIVRASRNAREAVRERRLDGLAEAVRLTYSFQVAEGMDPLPEITSAIAMKYLGGGHRGYALYLFRDRRARDAAHGKNTKVIEPYVSGL